MVTVTQATAQQINSALNSLRNEINENIKNIEIPESEESGGEGTSTYEFTSPLSEEDGVVKLDTSGEWQGSAGFAERAEKDNLGNIINDTYISKTQKGLADGVAALDENGRLPYSQLPESAVEFKGTWNAETNTPTITQGQGTNGDFYIVSVGGTWSDISFEANDRIIFDGNTNTWIKLEGNKYIYSAPIGSIVLSACDISSDGYLLCDGSTYDTSSYSELYSKIGTNVLPDFNNRFAEGTTTPEEVMSIISAGLPNITGSASSNQTYSGTPYSLGLLTGAFKSKAISGTQYFLNGRSTGSGWVNMEFDASNSNSIYGNSTTVQPPAIKVYFFIKAKNSDLLPENAIQDYSTTYNTTWSSEKISSEMQALVDIIYPIGSIYMSTNSVDPGTFLGGTWEQIKDKFLLSSGDTYVIGKTGGQSTITLSTENLPKHNHNMQHLHKVTASGKVVSTSLTGTFKPYQPDGGGYLPFGSSSAGSGIFSTETYSSNIHQVQETSTNWSNGKFIKIDATHSHTFNGSEVRTGDSLNTASPYSSKTTTGDTGSGSPHTNMPPYLVINVWKRTS